MPSPICEMYPSGRVSTGTTTSLAEFFPDGRVLTPDDAEREGCGGHRPPSRTTALSRPICARSRKVSSGVNGE